MNSSVVISLASRSNVQDRHVRDGSNPRTGETMNIVALRKLTFATAKAVKDALGAA